MSLRKLVYVAVALLFCLQAGALTLTELQNLYDEVWNSSSGDSGQGGYVYGEGSPDTLYYGNSADSLDNEVEEDSSSSKTDMISEFSTQAALFIEDCYSFGELDSALDMWKDTDQESCRTFLDDKLASGTELPKYLYLNIRIEDDTTNMLHLAQALIVDYPGYEGGYRALVLTYLQNIDPADLSDLSSDLGKTLSADLPSFKALGEIFWDDEYADLALIYYYARTFDSESAKPFLRKAVEQKQAWLANIDLSQLIPLKDYHELLEYYIDLLWQQPDHEDNLYHITESAGYLMGYYLDEAKDYDKILSYFGPDPAAWQNEYIVYGVILSNYKKGAISNIAPLITYKGDAEAALNFQDSWLGYSASEALEVYNAVYHYQPDDALVAYLCARAQSTDADKLNMADSLAAKYPRLDYGYKLATETYITYFGTADATDEQRPQMLSFLQRDLQLLRNYYFRFQDDDLAALAYFLANVIDKDDPHAIKAYNTLSASSLSEDYSAEIDKLLIDFDRTELLWLVKDHAAQLKAESDNLDENATYNNQVTEYLAALFNNNKFQNVIDEVSASPQWGDIRDVQFLVVNSYYTLGDYDKTISSLHMMVEKGTMGTTLLLVVEDENLTSNPEWQKLLDYAATMPDPDAVPPTETPAPEDEGTEY